MNFIKGLISSFMFKLKQLYGSLLARVRGGEWATKYNSGPNRPPYFAEVPNKHGFNWLTLLLMQ